MTDATARLVVYPCFTRLPPSGEARPGGEAALVANAGLVGVLALSDGGPPLGAGYQAPFTVPLGLASTAVLGALGAPDPAQASWTIREIDVRWHRAARVDDDFEAHARVEHVDARAARVHVATSSGGEAVLDATMRVVPVREGRYAPVAAAVPPTGTWAGGTGDAPDATSPPPLLRVRAPRIVAGPPHVEVAFEPDVLRLLMNTVAGHAEPLGRRVHPLGNAPVGAALTAALVAAGDPDPWRPVVRIVGARLTFYRALSLAAGWTARATVDGPSRRCRFEVAGTGAPLAVAGSVEWAVS